MAQDKLEAAQIKTLESAKKVGQLLARLRQSFLSAQDMREILTLISVEPSVARKWFNVIDNISMYGFRWLIENQPQDAQRFGATKDDLDEFDPENDREPWLYPPMQAYFKAVISENWITKVNRWDALSQIGAIAFEDEASYADLWEGISDKVWTEWAKTKGNNAIIKGAVKRGKTNFALLLAEKFMQQGWMIVSNIQAKNPPSLYRYAPILSSALKAICEARLQGLYVLMILDEAGLFYAKIDTVLKQSRELSKLTLVLGKLWTTLLGISHYSSDIPTAWARTAVAEFEKTSIKNVHVHIDDGIKLRPRLVTSVPATTIQYDPDLLSSFQVDMICQRLWDFMAQIPEGENQWKKLLGYIENNTISPTEEWLDSKQVAQWMRDRGKSVTEISRALNEPLSNISRWTREKALVEGEARKHSSRMAEGRT
jgi:hypothetical protein